MYTDPISDYLTRIRNAQMAGHKVVDIPASNMKREMTKILHDKGYILNYKFEDDVNFQGNIKDFELKIIISFKWELKFLGSTCFLGTS